MPRRIRSGTLETRTARLKLAQQRKPYWSPSRPASRSAIAATPDPARGTCAPPTARAATGSRASRIADDQEDADGANVLDSGKPPTRRRRWRAAAMPTRDGLRPSMRR